MCTIAIILVVIGTRHAESLMLVPAYSFQLQLIHLEYDQWHCRCEGV